MRRFSALLLAAILPGCSAPPETPRQPPSAERPIEGKWDAKVRVEEAAFIDDTLQLLPGGSGFAHRLKVTLSQVGNKIDSAVYDFKRQQITWEIVTDEEGPSLCVTGQNGPQRDCGPVDMVSDSVMHLGNFRYRLIRPTSAP